MDLHRLAHPPVRVDGLREAVSSSTAKRVTTPTEDQIPYPVQHKPTRPWAGRSLGLGPVKGVLVGVQGALVAANLLSGCASLPAATGAPLTTVSPPSECIIEAELRSWVVFGVGRHLRLDAEGGCGTRPFSVEYADAKPVLSLEGVLGFGNAAIDSRILPPGGQPAPERVEARYELSAETAECLAELRVYEHAYRLTGPNSSSALRATMTTCGLPLPDHLPGSGGALQSFPGIDHEAGRVRFQGSPEDLGLYSIHSSEPGPSGS